MKNLQFLLQIPNQKIRYFLAISLCVILLATATQWWIMVHALVVVWLLSIITWCYIAGNTLYNMLPEGIRMPYSFFNFNVTYAYGYLFAFFMLDVLSMEPTNSWVYIFHIYFAYSMLYSIFFISKCLVSIEEQRKVDYFDYRITFYEFCFFFPFTAMPIQKRIQGILKENS